mmetsp:Transcript_32227/g.74373  ORF Transcript_32227/g.74373 Transcript_32227/m.74373 type:complete len:142 (+) Transcript_32227:442-867(+)
MKTCTAAKSSTGHRGSITFLVMDQFGASTINSHRYCGKKVMTLKAELTTEGVGSKSAIARETSGSTARGAADERCQPRKRGGEANTNAELTSGPPAGVGASFVKYLAPKKRAPNAKQRRNFVCMAQLCLWSNTACLTAQGK